MLLACVTAGALPAFAQSDWHDPFPPHRIADHLYYVGSKGLASYLITTTNGHILINSSFERTVPILRTNIEALGFKFTDIKILLTSHAHSDHASSHALVKKLTGARVEVMEGDAQVIANGGKGQYLYTDDKWKPCVVDRVLKDGNIVTLGEARLTARLTPGQPANNISPHRRIRDPTARDGQIRPNGRQPAGPCLYEISTGEISGCNRTSSSGSERGEKANAYRSGAK